MSPDLPYTHLAVKSGIISLGLMLLCPGTTPLAHAGKAAQ